MSCEFALTIGGSIRNVFVLMEHVKRLVCQHDSCLTVYKDASIVKGTFASRRV
jgi:hypothetical protein